MIFFACFFAKKAWLPCNRMDSQSVTYWGASIILGLLLSASFWFLANSEGFTVGTFWKRAEQVVITFSQIQVKKKKLPQQCGHDNLFSVLTIFGIHYLFRDSISSLQARSSVWLSHNRCAQSVLINAQRCGPLFLARAGADNVETLLLPFCSEMNGRQRRRDMVLFGFICLCHVEAWTENGGAARLARSSFAQRPMRLH